MGYMNTTLCSCIYNHNMIYIIYSVSILTYTGLYEGYCLYIGVPALYILSIVSNYLRSGEYTSVGKGRHLKYINSLLFKIS